MAWIELHDTLPDHPKVLRLADALDMDKDMAAGKLIRLWTWALTHREDGCFDRRDMETIAEAARYKGKPRTLVNALVKARLLDQEEGMLRIHGWEERVGLLMERREKQRAQGRERARLFRERNRESGPGDRGAAPAESSSPDAPPDPSPALPSKRNALRNGAVTAEKKPDNAPTVPYRTLEDEEEDDDDLHYERARARAEDNVASAYLSAFGRPPNKAELNDMAALAATLGLTDVIHRAVSMAALKGARSVPAYVRAIGGEWRFNRITNQDQLDEYLYLSDCAAGRLTGCGALDPAEARRRIQDTREARWEAFHAQHDP